jgi:hypothetical protein
MYPGSPQNQPSAEETPLESWKEIAGFFGVTVRTAQIWEEERGLPVRRSPGGKGRVFAYPSELKIWRDSAQLPAKLAEEDSPPLLRKPSASRRRWLAGGALALAYAAGLWWFHHRTGEAASWRLDGQSLIVSDNKGREVWRHAFPEAPEAVWSKDGSVSSPLFLDLDGDGRKEFMFPNKGSSERPRAEELLCFSAKGDVLWTYKPGRAVAARSRSFTSQYAVRLMALVPAPGQRESRLLVASNNNPDEAMQVVLLDSTGKQLREYWHAGHFAAVLVTDLDGNGRPEIYLGGVANGYGAADLVVLDPDSFAGASHEENARFQMLDMPPPMEMGRVLFPRSSLNLATEPYNAVTRLTRAGGDIQVGVTESFRRELGAANHYTFGAGLVLKGVSPGDTNAVAFTLAHAQKLLKADLTQVEIDSYRNIRFLTPWHP